MAGPRGAKAPREGRVQLLEAASRHKMNSAAVGSICGIHPSRPRTTRLQDAGGTPAPQTFAILVLVSDKALAWIIHELDGNNWKLFREETLWLFSQNTSQ